jgi:rubredoxin
VFLKTATAKEVNMTEEKLPRYESPCTKYVYNPEEGDYERNIPPGTPFEELPDDWCCPLCEAEKEFFEELED